MEKEFDLSECISSASKIRCENDFEFISLNAVKEFIRRLKEELCSEDGWEENPKEIIDKLAGERLV